MELIKHLWFCLISLSSVHLGAQVKPDTAGVLDVQRPCQYALCAEILNFNDSLVVPDSLFEKYHQVYWKSMGPYKRWSDVLLKKDSIHVNWAVGWPEHYTDGRFGIDICRNYLVAGVLHDNPNPNLLVYLQPISSAQYREICALLLSEKLNSVVLQRKDLSAGRLWMYFDLNLVKLGLYEVNYSYTKAAVQITEKMAEEQFYKGLLSFVKVLNLYLTEKIPLPGVEYRHCYTHAILNGEGYDVIELKSK